MKKQLTYQEVLSVKMGIEQLKQDSSLKLPFELNIHLIKTLKAATADAEDFQKSLEPASEAFVEYEKQFNALRMKFTEAKTQEEQKDLVEQHRKLKESNKEIIEEREKVIEGHLEKTCPTEYSTISLALFTSVNVNPNVAEMLYPIVELD